MNIETPALLFVYGTLRRGCDNDRARRLAAEARYIGSAFLYGHIHQIIDKDDGTAYPALVPGAFPGAFPASLSDGPPIPDGTMPDAEARRIPGWVPGDLFLLHTPAATLGWLDLYEEAGPAFPEPRDYERVRLPVLTAEGNQETAWVYISGRSL